MVEIWKDIVVEKNGIVYDFTGLYQVSNMGRVKSLNYNKTGEEKILKTRLNKNGYLMIGLNKDKKQQQFYIHRLVAYTFIPNPNKLPQINHKNEIKTDNFVDNLEWCTEQYNSQYSSYKQKGKTFTEERKQKISEAHKKKVLCIETGHIFDSLKEAQTWLGKGNIKSCCRGIRKSAGGYHWQYVDDNDE